MLSLPPPSAAVSPSAAPAASNNLTTVDAHYRLQTTDYFHESIRECPPPFRNNNNGDGTFNNVVGDQFNNPHYHYYAPVFVRQSEPIPPSIDQQISTPETLSESYSPTVSNIAAVHKLLDRFPSRTMLRDLPALLEDMRRFASNIAIVARSLDIINDISTGIRELSAFRQAHDLIRFLNAHLLVIQQDIHAFYVSIRLSNHPSLIEIVLYTIVTKARWWAIHQRAVSLLAADHLVLETFTHTVCRGCWAKIITGEPARKLEQLIAASPLLKSPLVYHLRMLTLTVRDHAGRRLPIPLEYCSTWLDMKIVLKHLCHDVDGIEYLERDDWELIRTSNNETLDMDRPLSQVLSEESMLSGEIFDLSIIMHVVRALLSTCPGCRYDNSGIQVSCNSWITCGRCGKTFQVTSMMPALPPRRLLTEGGQSPLPTNVPEPTTVFRKLLQPIKRVILFHRRSKGKGKVKVKEEHLVPAPAPPVIERALPSAITNAQFPRISLRAESIQGKQRKSHCRYEIHKDVVFSVCFHNNGKQVLSADYSGWSLWDADTGIVNESGSFVDYVWCAAFSPDGLHVAAGMRAGSAQIWKIGSKMTPVTLKGYDKTVFGIAFSYDGEYLATCSEDNTVRIWSLTGKETTSQVLVCKNTSCIAFSPDGTLIASGSGYGRISIWDTKTGELKRELKGHDHPVRSISFSPDGTRILSGSEENTVWSTSGDPILTLCGHTHFILDVAWSPDGRHFASGSQDKTVRLWDSTTGQTLQVFDADDWVLSVAFSPDGSRLVSGNLLGTVHIWDTGLS